MRLAGDVEIIDRHDVAGLDRGDLDLAAEQPQRVAGLELAGQEPADPRPPESMIHARDQRLVVRESDPQGLAGLVVMHNHHGLVVERTGRGILTQDQVAGLDLFDRPRALRRMNRRARGEAGVDPRRSVLRGRVLNQRDLCGRLVLIAELVVPPYVERILVLLFRAECRLRFREPG